MVGLPRPSQGPGGSAVAGITLGSAALDRNALELPQTDTGDRLLALANPASARHFFGLQFFLEDLLGSPVDLVSEKALRQELRPMVEADAITI